MNYLINVNESNFSDILNTTAQMPVVFNFISQIEPRSIEMDSLWRRLADEYANQFILATVNCDEQPMIASQFHIQAVPIAYLFLHGHPVDMIEGVMNEAELRVRLANILPKESDLKFNQALEYLQDERYEEALVLLKDAWEMTDKKNSEFALLYAETYIAMKKGEAAKAILAEVPIQDRDSRWHGLQAQIELLAQAAQSPELKQLQADYHAKPSPEIAIKLANQLHQADQNEEALTLLFSWLKKDLNSVQGELKAQFLAILAAMGNQPLVAKFRRLLYSLLY